MTIWKDDIEDLQNNELSRVALVETIHPDYKYQDGYALVYNSYTGSKETGRWCYLDDLLAQDKKVEQLEQALEVAKEGLKKIEDSFIPASHHDVGDYEMGRAEGQLSARNKAKETLQQINEIMEKEDESK